ncbi:beta-1,4-galactosyltransferase galt-1 [Elysia marginata]|uniref:Glycosyltransferase family 92 protein n=1 Tax=Elysia marginata TaxID=1093978 RepID=A0AAV4J6L2_9GAST|nr:beta-1,4-galactosyltransferase galt-1 [Elysia marginata]
MSIWLTIKKKKKTKNENNQKEEKKKKKKKNKKNNNNNNNNKNKNNKNKKEYDTRRGSVPQSLESFFDSGYAAAFIKCPLASGFQERATVIAVSVVSGQKCRSAGSRLPPLAVTHASTADDKFVSEFTVCVSPFNLRYSRAYELVEMLEFNKILGADNFVFYNYSMGPNVDRVLQKYIKSDDINVLPWHLPMRVDSWPPSKQPSEVWYFGQLAALNDCLSRYRYKARYIVFSDLDEFIVPLKDSSWAQLLSRLRKPPSDSSNHLQRGTRKNRDIFLFRCTFFRKEWPQPMPELEKANSKLRSAVLGFTLRETQVLPAGSRSKMIVNPRLVREVGVHQVWDGDASVIVPQSLGLLYHYRSWESPDQEVDLVSSKDVALRFGERLAAKMQEVWDSLPGVPFDIDIKSYGSPVS